MISEAAPAKINLFLHVGPARADGLHAISSLFVFAEAGDKLCAAPAQDLSLCVTGPFADALSGLPTEDNLVFKAAALLRAEFDIADGAALRLEKNLPVAAGVGGGSADAAAALRALIRLWDIEISQHALAALAFRLGADVPACLRRAPVAVAGAGEVLSPGPALPTLWACLANPGADMPTGPVFGDFDAAHPSPPPPQTPALRAPTYEALAAFMNASRNDLEPFAVARAPKIATVIKFLQDRPGALAARMSGSGATSFALFSSEAAAQRCAAAAKARGWWAMASRIAGG